MKNYKDITDDAGFLFDPDNWSKEFAMYTAKKIGINLTLDHWKVIEMIREQYDKSMRVPELRHTLKFIKSNMGENKATRKFIYQLFPYGYGQQGCLLAGMRQPKKLWLDL
tara:strand:- start:769 stop:1098 length:330 start_codon:yes stop_codon:yes gene_type:complete